MVFMFTQTVVYAAEGYHRTLDALAHDVTMRRNHSPVQTFHVQDFQGDAERFFVYWPESRRLISLPIAHSKFNEDWDDPSLVARFTDLENGVVNSLDEVGSSTYLETVDFVEDAIRLCLDGEAYVVSLSHKSH